MDDKHFSLLQDFSMPTRIKRIWETNDRNYIFVLGEYPAQIKCLDVHQMSMKYDRFLRDEALDGISLSDDFRKFAVLLRHRKEIEFHDPNGVYTRIRCPAQPNSLHLNEATTHLLLPSDSSNAVSRLSLHDGAFHSSYDISPQRFMGNATPIGSRAVCTLVEHHLDLIGCEDGYLRCFDPRTPTQADESQAALNPHLPVSCVELPDEFRLGVSSIAADPRNSFHFAVGTAGGKILLYDLRKKQPFLAKDHCNELPIRKITYYRNAMNSGLASNFYQSATENLICSMDSRSIHFWEKTNGETLTVVEPFSQSSNHGVSKKVFDYTYRASIPPSIHDFTIISNHASQSANLTHSGLMLLGMEQSEGYGIFLPHIGAAPKWCAYLNKLATTTNAEEKRMAVEEDRIHKEFVFLSQAEFDALGVVTENVSLDVIRPMMNGYLIDHKHLRFLRQTMEYQKPYQKATKSSKLIKKLKKQDPITPVERVKVRKSKKKSADADERFVNRMEAAPDLYRIDKAQEKSKSVSADANRNAAYDAMFAEVRSLRSVDKKGLQTMKLQKSADFYAPDETIAHAYSTEHMERPDASSTGRKKK